MLCANAAAADPTLYILIGCSGITECWSLHDCAASLLPSPPPLSSLPPSLEDRSCIAAPMPQLAQLHLQCQQQHGSPRFGCIFPLFPAPSLHATRCLRPLPSDTVREHCSAAPYQFLQLLLQKSAAFGESSTSQGHDNLWRRPTWPKYYLTEAGCFMWD